ncbi:MAG: hydroxyethylthiazole kinase, partial [Kiritimatiellae bacterium]|nr:hydroxyethylthiazole kinase [Kiritimatiellia bacterium]
MQNTSDPAAWTRAAGALLEEMRRRAPLVHCLTNHVVTNFTANVLLAAGAAPAMIHDPEESAIFAGVASALLVNVGTIEREQAEAMRRAVAAANAAGRPWVLDPVAVGALLLSCGIPAEQYESTASPLTWLLLPATVCLAVPLHERFHILRQNAVALLAGIISGVLTSLVSVFGLSLLLGFNHRLYVTVLPKSITTAIGMGVSEELGGYVTIT